VSSLNLTVTFQSKVTIVQCYTPTNVTEKEEKSFTSKPKPLSIKTKERHKILTGDLNAKVGADNSDRELIMGRQEAGNRTKTASVSQNSVPSTTLLLEEQSSHSRKSIRSLGLPQSKDRKLN
jgi:hypothetical protein